MLTVAKVTQGAAAGYADYLNGRSQPSQLGDYYLKDGERVEAPGRWAGGSAKFGIDPQHAVSGEHLRALMAVRRPDDGGALRPVGANGKAVAALDATFSAPKSVSVVWAAGGPELRRQLENAHEQAIDLALSYAIEHVPMTRQRIDSRSVIHTMSAGLIATSWRHTTARSVDGRPPDPQLHSHVLLHGAIRADGAVAAIDSRSWFTHRREIGAAYRTELARELTGLGFDIQRGTGRGGRYFEIAGVTPELLDRWSGRHHQVHEAIRARLRDKEALLLEQARHGGSVGEAANQRLHELRRSETLGAAEERHMTTSTRSAKTGRATHADLDEHWMRTARSFGLDPTTVNQLRSGGRELPPASASDLLTRLTEFEATFPEHAARAVALEASAGASVDEGLAVLDRAAQTADVVVLADELRTTRAHRAVELETVEMLTQLSTRRVPTIRQESVAREAQQLDSQLRARGNAMVPEQLEALRLACSDRQLVVIEGQAGTGKSTVLAAVARAHQADGRDIVVTSTGSLAAQRLAGELRSAGVDANAYSTTAMHAAVAGGWLHLGFETTVIHDEAALASTREQHQLLSAVDDSGARLIEVGDPRQSKPVGAGGLWSDLEQATEASFARIELTRNVRAHDPADRRDQKLFRTGATEEALAGYDQRERIIRTEERRVAEDRALEAAHADRQAGLETLVIAQTSNEHLDELNARAQAIRLEHDELGATSIAARGRPYTLHAGDRIQIRRNLYRPDGAALRNGTTGEIKSIDRDAGSLRLEMSDGELVTLASDDLARADARLAYVQHPFPAQGQTTDTAHLIVAEHATQEGSYVALTRARERTHIYASQEQPEPIDAQPDQRESLAGHMSRTEPDIPSIHIPLAHENEISAEQDRSRQADPEAAQDPSRAPLPRSPAADRREVPDYLAAALGEPPPANDPGRKAWEQGAMAIERYRNRYGITPDEERPLGPEPPTGEFKQRHDHRRTTEEVAHTRQQLDQHSARLHLSADRDLEGVDQDVERSAVSQLHGLEP